MKTVTSKTFEVYIKELIYHPERAKKWLADKRLTTIEKSILRGHLLVRDNKNIQALKEIESTPNSDIELINDHKNLLMGICHNNIGNFSAGEKFLKLARIGFEEKEHNYHLFTTLYNLTLLYSNLEDYQAMGPIVHRMEELRVDGKLPKIRLLRCQSTYAICVNDIEKSWHYIKEIKSLRSEMPESELGPQLINEFIFYIKIEDLDKAESVITEMKNYRKFTLSENYNFMKVLLAYLRNDTTIYAYDDMFASPTSTLLYMIRVIEKLQVNDKDGALVFWEKLKIQHSESLYGDNFQWKGEKCLFSLCIEKNLKKISMPSLLQFVNKGDLKHKIIFDILSKSGVPVKAAELYEIIYNEPIVDKDDLKKLARMMVYVREEYKVEITAKKGTYQLVQNIAPAAEAISKKFSLK